MLFKKCKFKDKSRVRKTTKEAIQNNVKIEVPYSLCNEGRILEYIDMLLDESEYNIREGEFFYKYRAIKINLDVDLFSKVAVDYINEHLDDFLLTKHLKN